MRLLALLGLAATLATAPAQAALIGIDIGFNLVATQTSATTLSAEDSFFSARAFTSTPGDFDSGTLVYFGPDSPVPLTPQAGQPLLAYQTGLLSGRAALDAAYPSGPYFFHVANGTTSDSANASLVHGADAFAANAPVIANFDALSAIDPGQAFTLALSSGFTGGTGATSAFTFVNIFDQTSGVAVYRANFQSAGTTSFVIAPNTFAAGGSYLLEANFSSRIDGFDNTIQTTQLFDRRTLANFAVPAAAAVPEPAAWALLIGGFGLIGAAARRRREGYASPTA